MVSIKHKKVLTIPDDPDAVAAGMVVSSDWNNVLDFKTAAALILLGRKMASAGDVEELTASDARTLLGLVPGTAAGNIPVLDGSGKLDTSILPSLAITETFVVNSQAAMLALTAQTGDVAIRTDLNKTFILSTNNPGTLADWKEMLTPTDAVLSVAGLTGAADRCGSVRSGSDGGDQCVGAQDGAGNGCRRYHRHERCWPSVRSAHQLREHVQRHQAGGNRYHNGRCRACHDGRSNCRDGHNARCHAGRIGRSYRGGRGWKYDGHNGIR